MTNDDATKQLYTAISNGNVDDAQAALLSGANVNTKIESVLTPLRYAMSIGHLPVVEFLIDRGADINLKDYDGDPALHSAVKVGDSLIVKLLIEKGADLDAENEGHQTPRQLAADRGLTEIVTLLNNAAKQQGHAARVAEERKDKGPPQVGG